MKMRSSSEDGAVSEKDGERSSREGAKGGSKTRQNVSLDVGKKRSHEATGVDRPDKRECRKDTVIRGSKKRRVLVPTASWETAFKEQVESTFQSTSKTKTSRENAALVKPVTADRVDEEKVNEGKTGSPE